MQQEKELLSFSNKSLKKKDNVKKKKENKIGELEDDTKKEKKEKIKKSEKKVLTKIKKKKENQKNVLENKREEKALLRKNESNQSVVNVQKLNVFSTIISAEELKKKKKKTIFKKNEVKEKKEKDKEKQQKDEKEKKEKKLIPEIDVEKKTKKKLKFDIDSAFPQKFVKNSLNSPTSICNLLQRKTLPDTTQRDNLSFAGSSKLLKCPLFSTSSSVSTPHYNNSEIFYQTQMDQQKRKEQVEENKEFEEKRETINSDSSFVSVAHMPIISSEQQNSIVLPSSHNNQSKFLVKNGPGHLLDRDVQGKSKERAIHKVFFSLNGDQAISDSNKKKNEIKIKKNEKLVEENNIISALNYMQKRSSSSKKIDNNKKLETIFEEPENEMTEDTIKKQKTKAIYHSQTFSFFNKLNTSSLFFIPESYKDLIRAKSTSNIKWLLSKAIQCKINTEKKNYCTTFKMNGNKMLNNLNNEIEKIKNDFERFKKKVQNEVHTNFESLIPKNWTIDESNSLIEIMHKGSELTLTPETILRIKKLKEEKKELYNKIGKEKSSKNLDGSKILIKKYEKAKTEGKEMSLEEKKRSNIMHLKDDIYWFGPTPLEVFGKNLIIRPRNPYSLLGVVTRRLWNTTKKVKRDNLFSYFNCIPTCLKQSDKHVSDELSVVSTDDDLHVNSNKEDQKVKQVRIRKFEDRSICSNIKKNKLYQNSCGSLTSFISTFCSSNTFNFSNISPNSLLASQAFSSQNFSFSQYSSLYSTFAPYNYSLTSLSLNNSNNSLPIIHNDRHSSFFATSCSSSPFSIPSPASAPRHVASFVFPKKLSFPLTQMNSREVETEKIIQKKNGKTANFVSALNRCSAVSKMNGRSSIGFFPYISRASLPETYFNSDKNKKSFVNANIIKSSVNNETTKTQSASYFSFLQKKKKIEDHPVNCYLLYPSKLCTHAYCKNYYKQKKLKEEANKIIKHQIESSVIIKPKNICSNYIKNTRNIFSSSSSMRCSYSEAMHKKAFCDINSLNHKFKKSQEKKGFLHFSSNKGTSTIPSPAQLQSSISCVENKNMRITTLLEDFLADKNLQITRPPWDKRKYSLRHSFKGKYICVDDIFFDQKPSEEMKSVVEKTNNCTNATENENYLNQEIRIEDSNALKEHSLKDYNEKSNTNEYTALSEKQLKDSEQEENSENKKISRGQKLWINLQKKQDKLLEIYSLEKNKNAPEKKSEGEMTKNFASKKNKQHKEKLKIIKQKTKSKKDIVESQNNEVKIAQEIKNKKKVKEKQEKKRKEEKRMDEKNEEQEKVTNEAEKEMKINNQTILKEQKKKYNLNSKELSLSDKSDACTPCLSTIKNYIVKYTSPPEMLKKYISFKDNTCIYFSRTK